MTYETFEEYLQVIFSDKGEFGGIPIVKDNCDDLFENWVEQLDVSELTDFAEKYGRKMYEAGKVDNLIKA